MASLRASTQSIAAYRSSSSQPDTTSSWPSELVAVSVHSPRAKASLEPGAITWATSIAAHQIAPPRRRRVDQLLRCPDAPARCPAPRRHARAAGCG